MGAVISIVGAVAARKKAAIATAAADNARATIALHRRISELTELDEQGRRTSAAIAAFRPGTAVETLRGMTTKKAAAAAGEYLDRARRLNGSLGLKDLGAQLAHFGWALTRFGEARTPEAMQVAGRELCGRLGECESAVHAALTAARERL